MALFLYLFRQFYITFDKSINYKYPKLKTMLQKMLTRSFFVCIAFTGMISIAFAQKKSIDDEFAKIPPYPSDFTTQKSGVLVVVYDKQSDIPDYDRKGPLKSLTKDLQKLFPLDYTGDYNFVVMSTDIEDESTSGDDGVTFKYKVTNPAYADVDKYRFVLFSQCYEDFTDGGNVVLTYFRFGIYDRKTDAFSTTLKHTGSQKPLMETFVKKLEEVRVK
jgi:hypothetical protein